MDAQSKSPLPGTISGAAGTRRALSAELIAILGVGATLGILTLAGMHGIRADMRDIRVDVREMGARLAGVEQRVAGLEQQVAGVERRVAGVERRVAGVEQRMATLEGLFEGFRDSIDNRWPPPGEEKS